MTVIDVGANRGWYTVLAAHRVAPGGRVLALEPGTVAAAQLRRNLALNPTCEGVEVLEAAAAAASGHGCFVEERDISLSRLAGTSDPRNGRAVPQVRLDELAEIRAMERIDLVKIDVEGAEVEVLEGLRRVLGRPTPPMLLVECLERNLNRYGSGIDDLLDLLDTATGGSYDLRFLCRRHGCAEPPASACRDASNNLLAVPSVHRPQIDSLFAGDREIGVAPDLRLGKLGSLRRRP